MKARVLVVDDERIFRVMAEEALGSEGFDVRAVGSLAGARRELQRSAPDLMILDRRLPDGDGLDFLKSLSAEGLTSTLVVMVTAYADVPSVVDALQAGAVDYLTKPLQVTELVVKLNKVLETRGLRDQLALARGSTPPGTTTGSAAMGKVLGQLARVAESPLTPVLFSGPSGAGKQHAAELLHAMTFPDPTHPAPFVELNCAALPANLLESELFGHERGAFTDAKATRRGLIELANGGTLFLDEVAELPEPSQAKLLKFLDSMRFRRLGGQLEIEVSLRIVAATNQSLIERTRSGGFREDLYHRLAVFQIHIPSLAERREDLAALAHGFVVSCSRRVKKRIDGLSPEALTKLSRYAFPGNVRELRNIIERAIILTEGQWIGERDIVTSESASLGQGQDPALFSVSLDEDGAPRPLDWVERQYVARVLEHLGGRRLAAAQALGISYPTLLKRLRELGVVDTDEA
jgi:two-component system response regulator AtoC